MDITDLINGIPRDAADDNYNSFDPYPPVTVGSRLGEVGDLDFLDPAGAFLLPVERLRRYVTPADINGRVGASVATGTTWTALPNRTAGADQWGTRELLQLLPSARALPARSPTRRAPVPIRPPGVISFRGPSGTGLLRSRLLHERTTGSARGQ